MNQLISPANRILASVGTAFIFMQMLLICSDITGRYVFNRPIAGVSEMIELTIVAIVFLQLPNTIATGSLVRSDAVFTALTRSRPRVAKVMDIFFSIVGVAVLSIIAYGIWFKLALAIARNHFTGSPGVFTAPIWPALLCIFVGSAWGALNFLLIAFQMNIDDTQLAKGANE